MDALVWVVCEGGYERASISAVCARARVSHRAFYESFPSLEESFLAVLDDGFRRTVSIVGGAFARSGSWKEGIREALLDLLIFLESEPRLARVWLIESAAAGAWSLHRRERNVDALTRTIVGELGAPPSAGRHPLAPVAVMSSVLRVVQSHLLAECSEPLVSLLGPLMGIVASPYLDAAEVTAEIERAADSAAQRISNGPSGLPPVSAADLPDIVTDPRAHRARAVLFCLSSQPEASNRQIADAIGARSRSQVSTLLAKLSRDGLLEKRPTSVGARNRWVLTVMGDAALAVIAELEAHSAEGHVLSPR